MKFTLTIPCFILSVGWSQDLTNRRLKNYQTINQIFSTSIINLRTHFIAKCLQSTTSRLLKQSIQSTIISMRITYFDICYIYFNTNQIHHMKYSYIQPWFNTPLLYHIKYLSPPHYISTYIIYISNDTTFHQTRISLCICILNLGVPI